MANIPTRPDRDRGANIPVERTDEPTADNRGQVWIASGLNVLLGLWLIIAPFILAYREETVSWNSILVGAAVVVLAGIRLIWTAQSTWASWLNAVLGLWLLVSPWVLNYREETVSWNAIIVGVLITALAVWSALATRTAQDREQRVP